MTWPLAGHTLGTPDHDVIEALHLFAAAGLDAAELIWVDDYRSGIPETDNHDLIRQIVGISEELALPIVGLTPYMAGINSMDHAVRLRDIERFRRCIADAEALGAQIVRVYAGEYTPERIAERSELWNRLVESLQTLAPVAADAGVTLAVENHFNTMTVTAAETVNLVRDVAHPAVAILYDQANLTFTHSEGYVEALALQADRICHVHAKDLIFVDRDRPFSASAVATVTSEERAVRSRVIGDGEIDWQAILRQLAATGYTGAISLEYEYRWHRQDLPEPSAGFRRGAETLRSYFEGHRTASKELQ